jgi:hypothetical protein
MRPTTCLAALTLTLALPPSLTAADQPATIELSVPREGTLVLTGDLSFRGQLRPRAVLSPDGKDIPMTRGLVGPQLQLVTKPLASGKVHTVNLVYEYTVMDTAVETPAGRPPRTIYVPRTVKVPVTLQIEAGKKVQIDLSKENPKPR